MSKFANIFVPYLRRGEFTAILKKQLDQPSAADAFVEEAMPESALVSAIARVQIGSELAWAAFLSRACSGFCLALDDTVSVFYAGQHLKDSPSLEWECWYAKIVGLWAVPPIPILQEALSTSPVKIAATEVWTRAAILLTTAEDAESKREQLEGWDWSIQSTPTASIPLLIADRFGPADPYSLSAMSKALGDYGTAVEFNPSGSCRTWWMDLKSQPVEQEAPDAAAVVESWHDLAKLAGEGAACMRRYKRCSNLRLK